MVRSLDGERGAEARGLGGAAVRAGRRGMRAVGRRRHSSRLALQLARSKGGAGRVLVANAGGGGDGARCMRWTGHADEYARRWRFGDGRAAVVNIRLPAPVLPPGRRGLRRSVAGGSYWIYPAAVRPLLRRPPSKLRIPLGRSTTATLRRHRLDQAGSRRILGGSSGARRRVLPRPAAVRGAHGSIFRRSQQARRYRAAGTRSPLRGGGDRVRRAGTFRLDMRRRASPPAYGGFAGSASGGASGVPVARTMLVPSSRRDGGALRAGRRTQPLALPQTIEDVCRRIKKRAPLSAESQTSAFALERRCDNTERGAAPASTTNARTLALLLSRAQRGRSRVGSPRRRSRGAR